MDYQVYGYQTKKVKWFEADANDEDACHAQVWAGAVCWEETVGHRVLVLHRTFAHIRGVKWN